MKGEEKMERETTAVAHKTITKDKQNREKFRERSDQGPSPNLRMLSLGICRQRV